MQKTFKTLLILIIIGIGYLNYSMYYTPNFNTKEGNTYNIDVLHQLQHLKEELHKGSGQDMQNIYPEGFIFLNALYGLTWCDLLQNVNKESPLFKEGIQEVDWVLAQIHSENGTKIFDKHLPIKYGAFYAGWSNYLLAQKLALLPVGAIDTSEKQQFIKKCDQIRSAIEKSETPYLESYRNQAWPADMLICVASLALHDQLFEKRYTIVIEDWLAKVKQRLDKETGLIPHAVAASSGNALEGARGCSQSLILNFLKDIDPHFASEQFKIYKTLFVDYRFGLPGIREYPKGRSGWGDIDSGPVLLGIGGAASIVGQRTMAQYQDWTIYEGLRNSIEGFGVGMTFNKKKRYIFGVLPMADAFIAWANVMETKELSEQETNNWRYKFHLLSLVLLVILLVCLLKIK